MKESWPSAVEKGGCSAVQPAFLEIADDLACRIMAGRTGHAPSGVCPGPAQIKPGQCSAVVAVAQHRAGGIHLVQTHRAVEDVATDQPEGALKIERAHDLAAEHGRFEVWREAINGVDHQIGDLFAVEVPGLAVR